ncbi:acetyl-CoA C-acyltransferase [Cupriavidus metallidurans]|uniref:acetyl-CoA C-acyltransferase n=1 Tax=Cupriavidus metallidurans TaxID=119219 RepID=UPI001CCD1AD2|nr:acetyl-CoA C-acyltransferase [Cupriavidus metallidurans]UBM08187.1 acetyl-CoA C-acyltransferase [Cupriavidus metallidurans]
MQDRNDRIVIVGAKRTPIGAFEGALSPLRTPQLGAVAIRAAVAQVSVQPNEVDEAIMGCCLFADLGQAPARQAVLGAGLAPSTPATTISKMCGSAMKSVMLAHDLLLAGTCTVAVAGGMESMTNAPHLIPQARQGYRLGHGALLDHMYRDGLEDAYEGKLMGHYADVAAELQGFTRAGQDEFAAESVTRAQAAVADGRFRDEIAPVTVKGRGGDIEITDDETPARCNLDRLATLKPAFRKEGTVTAGNASSISDGAAALVLMRESEAARRGATVLARFSGLATHAQAPSEFTSAPVGAIRRVLDKAGWTKDDVDLYEINEAFAVVTLYAMRELDLPHGKVNVNGGACALGHPVGATGARLLVSLLYALRQRGLRRGVAALCLGGGEATAMAIELA